MGEEHHFIRFNKINITFDAFRLRSMNYHDIKAKYRDRNPHKYGSKWFSLGMFCSLFRWEFLSLFFSAHSIVKVVKSTRHRYTKRRQVKITRIIISVFIRFQFTSVLAVMLRVNAFLLWSIYLQLAFGCFFFFFISDALLLQNQFDCWAQQPRLYCRKIITYK